MLSHVTVKHFPADNLTSGHTGDPRGASRAGTAPSSLRHTSSTVTGTACWHSDPVEPRIRGMACTTPSNPLHAASRHEVPLQRRDVVRARHQRRVLRPPSGVLASSVWRRTGRRQRRVRSRFRMGGLGDVPLPERFPLRASQDRSTEEDPRKPNLPRKRGRPRRPDTAKQHYRDETSGAVSEVGPRPRVTDLT